MKAAAEAARVEGAAAKAKAVTPAAAAAAAGGGAGVAAGDKKKTALQAAQEAKERKASEVRCGALSLSLVMVMSLSVY